VLNLLVLILLVAFLLLPHPALTLWPLAVATALAGGITTGGVVGEGREGGREGKIREIKGFAWAGFVGLLVVVILGSSYGLGRVVWGEIKFREALAAANRNEGIATYYALLDSIKRNPYEVRYHLLASQIDLALANSIAAQGGVRDVRDVGSTEEATASAQLSAQDQTNILILIQQAVVEGKAAVNLDPHNSALWQNLGSIYRALTGVASGAEDWALKCYQRAAELAPKDPSSWIGIGEIHYSAGNFEGARDGFAKAVELGPQLPLTHYDLAVAQNALGETDKAIAELEKVLGLLPEDSPDREPVEKDLEFLKGEGLKGLKGIKEEEITKTEELKEATTSAEVEAPPPPVGPEATESGKMEEPEGL
jgi:tetratricopeptide (TPR) repeat protein